MSWINDEFWINKKKEDKPKTEDKVKEDKVKEDKPKEDKPKEDKVKSRLDVSVRETILKRQGNYPKYKDDNERLIVNRKNKNEWAKNPVNKAKVKLTRLEKKLEIAKLKNIQNDIDKYTKLTEEQKLILDYAIKNSNTKTI